MQKVKMKDFLRQMNIISLGPIVGIILGIVSMLALSFVGGFELSPKADHYLYYGVYALFALSYPIWSELIFKILSAKEEIDLSTFNGRLMAFRGKDMVKRALLSFIVFPAIMGCVLLESSIFIILSVFPFFYALMTFSFKQRAIKGMQLNAQEEAYLDDLNYELLVPKVEHNEN